MTTFKRRGFYRTSKYGVEHWVNGTEVTRVDWWRSSGNRSDSIISRLWARHATEKAASTYVDSNAKCPVCEEPVYFYQNEFGSRVYFDDLGPPWPKHPCTDNAVYYKGNRTSAQIVEPAIREESEIEIIRSLLSQTHIDLDGSFEAKYKSKPWAPYLIEWCERRGTETLLILRRLTVGPLPRLFLRASGFACRAPIGSLVYFSRGRLSYFARRRAKVVEIVVSRIQGAKGFIDTLLEFSGRSERHA